MLFLERLISGYADRVSEFAIPMIIGIFAFVFPLIFQVISRIDDKYDSTLFIKVFHKECVWKCFKCIFGGALVSCVVWMFHIPRCVDWGECINILIDNSALILLVMSTIILVITTIVVIKIMYEYYVPKLLFNRLKNNYKKCNEEDKPMLFMAISKVMQYAIKKSDKDLFLDTLKFFSEEFSNYLKEQEHQPCEYPDEYYRVIAETNAIIHVSSHKEASFFDGSELLNLLLNGMISGKSFLVIWRELKRALIYNNENFIMSYWQQAHQYIGIRLKDKRFEEYEKMNEFNDALGGLLLMKKKYNLIKQLIFWTNQEPPKYVLVPETMKEVIQRFMYMESDINNSNPVYYEQKYPFPDVFEVFANDVIKMWIKRYIAILFLRQYILPEFYKFRRLEIPNISQTTQEKQKWIEELDVLKKYVLEYLSNEELLNVLGLHKLAEPDWLTKSGKPHPKELIEKLKGELNNWEI